MRSRALSLFMVALAALTIGAGLAGATPTPATAAVPAVAQALPAVAEAVPSKILATPPPSHHLSKGNGYNYSVNMFGIGVLDFYWQETAYVLANYSKDNYWADYLRLDDNPWLQLTTTLVDRPNFGPLTAERMCHPVTGACVGPVSLMENQVMVYAAFGWYRSRPFMRVFITPDGKVGWMMIRSDAL